MGVDVLGVYSDAPYYLSAYGLAVNRGFVGTQEEWLESLKGPGVMMRYSGNYVQWRRVDESDDDWRNVVNVDDLRGQVVSQTLADAKASATAAAASDKAAAASRDSAAVSASDASQSASAASGSEQRAAASAASAASSRDSAASDAASAKQSASAAAWSEQRAAVSETQAALSKDAAVASGSSIAKIAVAVASCEQRTAALEAQASLSRDAAASSAESALQSAAAASKCASAAAGSEQRAVVSETQAALSKDAAEACVASASEYASAAAVSEQHAKISENRAAAGKNEIVACVDQVMAMVYPIAEAIQVSYQHIETASYLVEYVDEFMMSTKQQVELAAEQAAGYTLDAQKSATNAAASAELATASKVSADSSAVSAAMSASTAELAAVSAVIAADAADSLRHGGSWFTKCVTAGAEALKLVNIEFFPDVDDPYWHPVVSVRFANDNLAVTPSLQVHGVFFRDDVSGGVNSVITGPKTGEVRYNGQPVAARWLTAGDHQFQWDGKYWNWMNYPYVSGIFGVRKFQIVTADIDLSDASLRLGNIFAVDVNADVTLSVSNVTDRAGVFTEFEIWISIIDNPHEVTWWDGITWLSGKPELSVGKCSLVAMRALPGGKFVGNLACEW